MNDKRVRFDKDNIRYTNHPPDKDYGLMSIPESKTPFPRHADPVEAKELYRRMQEALQRANMMMTTSVNKDDATDENDFQRASNEYEIREKQRLEFLTKRKLFYQSEFLIAKQKNMGTFMHPPGASVGSKWRIDETEQHQHTPSISSVPARYSSVISRHRLAQPGSFANRETLGEIADQVSRSSQWYTTNN